jgi:serine/tyrosine/threonine adenylyltransferase
MLQATTPTDEQPMTVPFNNTFVNLPERFFAKLAPTPVAKPSLIRLNAGLAHDLGLDLDWLASAPGVAMLAGNQMPAGAVPLAQAYAGHQFGGFSPQLGDGRAILLGEVVDRTGRHRDIQLKGSGPTPFSRRGDGRAALGPVLREYIVAEAMHALGIPTTRALAAVSTGEYVLRDAAMPGGVLTRVAASHIRVGTFQYFAARGDTDGVRALTDYVIARHYPDIADAPNRALALLATVCTRQADLIAQWLNIGFIHGVMNTDNMAISGETIDYGPCAFMDAYDPAQVFSSIDSQGRYAYANQPSIGMWNLTRLAETLLPLINDDQDSAIAAAQETINIFPKHFNAAHAAGLRRKVGALTHDSDTDTGGAQDLLQIMASARADFTLTFRALTDAVADPAALAHVRSLFGEPAAFDAWAAAWVLRTTDGRRDERLAMMRAANPARIPRNHRVEDAIAAAVTAGDYAPFHALVGALARPYDDDLALAHYSTPPKPKEIVRATFCGT